MTRQAAIASLVHMLRPLGPMGDPEQREQEETAWATLAAGDERTMAALVDLARDPPTADESSGDPEGLQDQLVRVLALAGERAPAAVIDRVGPLTNAVRARATAIAVIATIGDPAGLRWLAPLVDMRDLSDDEATWLACAFGNIGTPEAQTLLERLAAHTPPERSVVVREIQIARDTITPPAKPLP